ncbi:MAG: hypothetical protein ACUVWA_13535 [Candidatus Oleimicrobiaceae bacterium]
MVSFGTGMQKTVSAALTAPDAFAAIRVLPRQPAVSGRWEAAEKEGPKGLPGSVVALIANLPGVKIAYSEVLLLGRRHLRAPTADHGVRGTCDPCSLYSLPYSRLGGSRQ